ncbi:hypothetical protein BYT27DRAFT_7097538 [Phlegmacium glaucopus]|nr:hypothetical protein BYT27DRAFT_7097538 [Phlegmacium glaucopus]
MAQILPPELWLEVFEWATHNPLLNVTKSPAPFQPISFHDNIRSDPNLNVRLTISLVCRQWKRWAARSLYSDIKIQGDSASGLRKALTTADGYYGEMVRRVVLQYNSTVPGPPNQLIQSIEILKLCPHIHTLLRPRFYRDHVDRLQFSYETAGVPLPALQRLEWWYHDEAERSGGINSLAAVLHSAPNLSYLFVGGVVGFNRICMQKEPPYLPQLRTLRLSAINGLLLYQIVSRWSLPSLTHIILDYPLTDSGSGFIWNSFGRQLKNVEFGRHLRFFTTDRLSPCLNSCPSLEELNFYLCFTSPAETMQFHTSLATVRLHATINDFLPDDDAVWDLIDRHFEILCGSNLPALRRIIFYGDCQWILHHHRFISIRDKLQEINRILEVSY